jgi:heat shock protein 5
MCAVQVYDVAPVALGGLSTSLAVPPLLAAFYAVLGALFIACDGLVGGPATERVSTQAVLITIAP